MTMKCAQEQGKLPQTYVINTQWKKQKYSKLPQGGTKRVALGLARENETMRKGVWAVIQVYLKNSQNQW